MHTPIKCCLKFTAIILLFTVLLVNSNCFAQMKFVVQGLQDDNSGTYLIKGPISDRIVLAVQGSTTQYRECATPKIVQSLKPGERLQGTASCDGSHWHINLLTLNINDSINLRYRSYAIGHDSIRLKLFSDSSVIYTFPKAKFNFSLQANNMAALKALDIK